MHALPRNEKLSSEKAAQKAYEGKVADKLVERLFYIVLLGAVERRSGVRVVSTVMSGVADQNRPRYVHIPRSVICI